MQRFSSYKTGFAIMKIFVKKIPEVGIFYYLIYPDISKTSLWRLWTQKVGEEKIVPKYDGIRYYIVAGVESL
jgi:hypothetical protein